jgi:hypothetical protein
MGAAGQGATTMTVGWVAKNIALGGDRRHDGGRRPDDPAHTALTFRNHRWLEATGLVTHARRLRLSR